MADADKTAQNLQSASAHIKHYFPSLASFKLAASHANKKK
jgi:hypothetical protein